MLVPANRYTIPTMLGLRITEDFGGASLERCRGGEWVMEAAAVSLDELLQCEALQGVRRKDLITDGEE